MSECRNCECEIDEDDSTDGYCDWCIEDHPQLMDDYNRERRAEERDDERLTEAREARND